MKRLAAIIALTGVALAAFAPTVKDSMKAVVEPASNTLFAVGGQVDPANGPDAAKTPEARWQDAAAAAASLHAASLALQQPDQAKPGEAWMKSAKAMVDLSAAAELAAKTKDGAKLAQAANDLGDTCSACHSQYKPKS